MASTDYLSQILGLNGSGTFTGSNQLPQTVTNNGVGLYSFNDINGNFTPQQIDNLLQGTDPGTGYQVGLGNYGSPAYNAWASQPAEPGSTVTNAATHTIPGQTTPNVEYYSDAPGGFTSAADAFKQSHPGSYGILNNYIAPAAEAAIASFIGGPVLGTVAGGIAAGAAVSAANADAKGGNPLTAALEGGAEGGAGSYLSSSALSGLNDQFPETMASINPFSDAANVAPTTGSVGDIDYSPSASNVSTNGSMSLPTGQSAPGSFGLSNSGLSGGSPGSVPVGSSPTVNFGSSGLSGTPSPLSGTDPLAGSSTVPSASGANITGGGTVTGAPPSSIFDNLAQGNISDAATGVGNFVQNNPITTLAGAGALYKGISGLNSNDSSSPSLTSLNPAPFSPTEQSAMALPGSLSSYANLDPLQQSTNIATRGVYGGGNGPQETNYFLNQINRQLFDQSGNVASNNNLPPIDMSYLNQLGISGSTPTDLLQGISSYGT